MVHYGVQIHPAGRGRHAGAEPGGRLEAWPHKSGALNPRKDRKPAPYASAFLQYSKHFRTSFAGSMAPP